MSLDTRLECLKEAVRQEWEDLEVAELGSSIVIKVKNIVDYKSFDASRTKAEKPRIIPLPH